ncbi:hypothetical protein ACIF8T_37180 [Streptomyces sp. NPDC085946]|uniref:hypothetical protein n=1 Tax=Streptomyces sp. NPDC085946 TaxID=3365744 RepID=UPI0037D0838A
MFAAALDTPPAQPLSAFVEGREPSVRTEDFGIPAAVGGEDEGEVPAGEVCHRGSADAPPPSRVRKLSRSGKVAGHLSQAGMAQLSDPRRPSP